MCKNPKEVAKGQGVEQRTQGETQCQGQSLRPGQSLPQDQGHTTVGLPEVVLVVGTKPRQKWHGGYV